MPIVGVAEGNEWPVMCRVSSRCLRDDTRKLEIRVTKGATVAGSTVSASGVARWQLTQTSGHNPHCGVRRVGADTQVGERRPGGRTFSSDPDRT